MKAQTVTIRNEHTLRLSEFCQMVAVHKGLRLCERTHELCSEPFRTYVLDQTLLSVLNAQGIRQHERSDCGGEIFTLVDENPQTDVPGWVPSNYWNFKLVDGSADKYDLRVVLSVRFAVNFDRCEVVLVPRAHGTFVSPADRLPNFRMFRALIENDPDAPAVAKELATSDGTIAVPWSELGLGGIRRLADLFAEFAAGNEAVAELGRSGKVFDPPPNELFARDRDVLLVSDLVHAEIRKVWRAQLRRYRSCLVL